MKIKKFLSVMLVLVLVLGFIPLTALAADKTSAEDYTDFEDITDARIEAIDVLTALGVIQGRPDGTLDPLGVVDRAQSVVIIANISLGPAIAATLPTGATGFKDVDGVNDWSWAAPAIKWAVDEGLVKGRGEGIFDPGAPVTNVEFAILLLKLIGYGQNSEYEGNAWATNGQVDGMRFGILTLGASANAAALREQMMQYALNAFKKNLVEYNSFMGMYYDAGTNPITGDVTTGKVTLGGRKFNLTWPSVGVDGLGFGNYVYKRGAITIAGPYEGDNIVATNMANRTVAQLTNKAHPAYCGFELDTKDVQYFYNGINLINECFEYGTDIATYTSFINGVATDTSLLTTPTDDEIDAFLLKLLVADVNTCSGTRGVIVHLIDRNNDDLVDKVVLIEKTVALVTGNVTTASNGNVTIPGVGTGLDPDDMSYPDGLAKGDVVLYVEDANDFLHIEIADSVEGQLTRRAGNNDITFGGSTYTRTGLQPAPSFTWDFMTYTDPAGGRPNFNVDSILYTDNGGYVVYITGETGPAAPKLFGLAVAYQHATGSLATGGERADTILWTADGKKATYQVVLPSTGSKNQLEAIAATYGLVSYTLSDDGVSLKADAATASSITTARGDNFVKIGSSNFIVSSNTVVIYSAIDPDEATISSLGNSNVPVSFGKGPSAIRAATAVPNVAYVQTNGVLDVIFFNYAAPAAAAGFVFLNAARPTGTVISPTITEWTWTAWVAGVSASGDSAIKTKNNDTLFFANTATATSAEYAFFAYDVDADGYVTSANIQARIDSTITSFYGGTGFTYNSGASTTSLNADTAFYRITRAVGTGAIGLVIESEPALMVGNYVDYIQMNAAGTVAVAVYYRDWP